jgi:anaerobic magnesium-protoporphyrin IX monomethyl ester cyclase
MKKALFINLSNKEQITRRYMCSYVSPESLFPPLELISLAAIARDSHNMEIKLIDAIAENLDQKTVLEQALNYKPDIIVSIMGLECIEEDCNEVKFLKDQMPNTKYVVFGHYATQFPNDVLLKSTADYLILGEPDFIFLNLLGALRGSNPLEEVGGVVRIGAAGNPVQQGEDKRIPNPNELPIPAYDILPVDKYYEPVLPRPYSLIQTARGCPYPCSFCVKSYGSKLTIQSPDRVVDEIQNLVQNYGIKSLRIIDDTFTVNKRRVIEICKELVKRNFNLQWCCLSRTDNLTDEMLHWMKKAGCTRIYFGLESGSQRILDLYQKGIKVEEAIETLLLCRKHGIETTGFFMSGFPEETEDDFDNTIAFAIKAKLTFASVNPLTPYPGTSLFDRLQEDIDFSLFPYKNEFKDPQIVVNFTKRKKKFYKAFYMRPNYVLSNVPSIIKNFSEISGHAVGLLKYVFFNGEFVISGLKGANDK